MTNPGRPAPGPARPAAVFGVYLLLATAFTYPLILHPADHVIGHVVREATPPLNIWAMAVVLHQLPHDPRHLFDGNAFYPYRDTLAFSEHLFVPALMASPVVALTGNWVLAYNVVTLVTLALAGCGMFLLARETVAEAGAAFVAGALYAFHTWNVNEAVRLQILSNEFFPFLLFSLVRFFRAPGWRWAVAVALSYGLQSLTCMYWALYAPLLVVAGVLFLASRYPVGWRHLARLGAALVVPLLALAVFAVPYVRSARALGFERPRPESVAIDRYLDVLPQNVLYASLLGTAGPNQNAAHFLGFVSLAAFALGAWPARRSPDAASDLRPLLVWLALAGFLLSLGPEIRIGEFVLGTGPYAALHRWVPGFRNVRYPERFSILLILGFAPLVAAGLARMRSRIGATGLWIVGALALAEHLSVPQFLDRLSGGHAIPEVYRAIAARKDVTVTAEIPASRNRLERFDALPMYYSTVHWRRIVEGFTSYFPPTYNFAKWRLYHFPEAASLAFLERFGVDTVVVRPEAAVVSAAAPDGRWTVEGPFEDGASLLHLARPTRVPDFAPPPPSGEGLVEIAREGWDVQASVPGAARAVDGDAATAWTTSVRQEKGAFFRVKFPSTEVLSRISVAVRDPYEFPMDVKLVVQAPDGEWQETVFDEAGAYDRLFALLLHRPRDAALDLDLAARPVQAFRLRIASTDPFAMPWTMAEIRAFRPR